MELDVYQADLSDLEFFLALLIKGARKGHFAYDPWSGQARKHLERDVRDALSMGCFCNGLRCQAMVFEHNGQRVGVAIMAEIEPGQGGNELLVLAVKPSLRRRGFGGAMLKTVLDGRDGVEIYARCSQASRVMFDMLSRHGFIYSHSNEQGYRVLRRPVLSHPNVVMAGGVATAHA